MFNIKISNMVTSGYINNTNNTLNPNYTLNPINQEEQWYNFVKTYIGLMYGRNNLINFRNDYETLCQWWNNSSPLGLEILPYSPVALFLVLDGGYVISNEIRLLLQDWKNRMHGGDQCMCIDCRRINLYQLCGFSYKQSMICTFHTILYNIPVHSVRSVWDSLELLVDMIRPLNNDPIETHNFQLHIHNMIENYRLRLY